MGTERSDSSGIIEILEARQVYRNRWGMLFDDNVRFPDRTPGTYLRFVWEAPYSVAVLPVTAAGGLVFVNVFRHASRRWHREVPKGFGAADLTPVQAAAGELKEETGFFSDAWQNWGTLWTDPGFNAGKCHLFVARNCEKAFEPTPEYSEVIAGAETLTPDEAAAGLGEGLFDDALTVCLVQRFLLERVAC